MLLSSSQQKDKLTYRREIDGLRCIAVLSVILYHFSEYGVLPAYGFGGGFVGVDVFFVISGYLIGGLLWRELGATGTVSLSRFYVRRLRRLAPAYFAMAASSLCVAYVILLPFEFREFGKELIAATVYLSNVNFFRDFGYFDIGAESKILLHTWSLAVEEQFYIFLPLLFLIFKRTRKVLLIVLILSFTLSLISSVLVTPISHSAAFYLFPFRAWELLTGVLLAVYETHRSKPWQSGPALSWIGIALLMAGIAFVKAGPTFPGIPVFVPVLATALLILNGRDNNIVNRALSSPAPVFVGLISYSLYLWHWPVLTLSRYYRDGYSGIPETILWLGVAFFLAYFSWLFVERPVRRTSAFSAKVLVAGTAFGSAGLLAAGGAVFLQDGQPDRFAPYVRPHIAASADFLQDFSRCSVQTSGPFEGLDVCPLGPEGQDPVFLVWGDSYARAIADGIALAAQEHNQPGLLIWRAGCPPLFDISKRENSATRQENEECSWANMRIREALSQISGIKRLLLVGRWSYYAEGQGTGLDAHNKIALSALPQAPFQTETQDILFASAVKATVAELTQYVDEIMVLRQFPEIPGYNSREISRLLAHNQLKPGPELQNALQVSSSELERRTRRAEIPFRQLASENVITVLDSWPDLCNAEGCSAMKDGQAFYFDNSHITNTAARALRHIFAPLLRPATPNSTETLILR